MSKSKKGKRVLAIVMLILFSIAVFVGYKSLIIANKFKSEEKVEALDKPSQDDKEKINILIVGADTGTAGNEVRKGRGRTDTIMIASFDPVKKDVKLLSIPRDSRVNIPGRGLDKINHAHAFGGIELTVKTVQEFLDVPIHHYARINFDGFISIVEILGGLTMTIEQSELNSVKSSTRLLQAGTHRLDGEQALQYVRIRSGDIGRVQRQQKFFTALLKETVQIGNVWRSPRIIEGIAENVETDMSVTKMLSFARMAQGIESGAVETEVLPGKGVYINRISYWQVDEAKKQELVDKFLKN